MTHGAMGEAAAVRALEEERRVAMLSGDTLALGLLLAPDLRYVHSTGGCDTRDSLLDKLRARQIAYEELRFEALDVTLSAAADAAFVTGEMRAQVRRDGELRAIATRYLAVWLRREGQWQLAACQGTSLPKD